MDSLEKFLNKFKGIKTNDEQEQQILTQVLQSQDRAEGNRSEMVEHANENRLYYFSKLPGKFTEMTYESKHVEPLAYLTVKQAVPQLFDSFVSNKRITAAFRNRGAKQSYELDRLVEYNVNEIILGKNKGSLLLKQLIKSVLIDANAVPKVWIDEPTYTEQDYQPEWVELAQYLGTLEKGWNLSSQLQKKLNKDENGKFKGFEWQTIKREQVQPESLEEMPQQPQQQPTEDILIKGKIVLEKREKSIKIEQVDLADMWFDISNGENYSKCEYMAQRIKTTVGEAELRGFDPEILASASATKSDFAQLPNNYANERVDYMNPAGTHSDLMERQDSTDPKMRPIDLIEHYTKSSALSKTGELRLYKVTTCNDKLLRVEAIKRFPFAIGACELVNGSFIATSLVDRVKRLQDTISYLRRLEVENAALSTHPRYITVKGQYDRQSLLNNRPGAIVEQMAAGSIDYLQRPPLDATFFQCIADLKEVAGDVMVQPTNAGTINSQGALPQVSTATMALKLSHDAMQGMELSNTIADTLIEPILDLVYEILRDEKIPLETPDGQIIEGDNLPALPELYKWAIDVQTTDDDTAKVMNLTSAVSFIAQLQGVQGNIITDQNKFNIAQAIFELSDLPNDGRFASDPAQSVDPHAAEEKALQQARDEELHGILVQHEAAKYLKTMAEKAHIDAEKEELIRNGVVNRAVSQQDAQTKTNKVITESQLDQQKRVIEAQKVDNESQRIEYDAMLGIAKQHSEHINRVNGHM